MTVRGSGGSVSLLFASIKLGFMLPSLNTGDICFIIKGYSFKLINYES